MQGPTLFFSSDRLPQGIPVVDAYRSSLKELYMVRNPQLRKGDPATLAAAESFAAGDSLPAAWVYYPWRQLIVRTLAEDAYLELRTARNRLLITEEEQSQYRAAHVGVAGLSVGSWAVSQLTATGGPRRMSIADFDHVEVSNLNRIRASLPDVGTNKAIIAARHVWEIDPFAALTVWEQGVADDTLASFVSHDRIDIFIDAMDNLALKVRAREVCRAARIPVLMATDLADGILLDVERFDEDDQYPFFHGEGGALTSEAVRGLDYRAWAVLATKIIGSENLPPRLRTSLLAIGTTLSAVPQLATGAAMAGAALAYAVRRIACRQSLPSGRYRLSIPSALYHTEEYDTDSHTISEDEFTKKFFTGG